MEKFSNRNMEQHVIIRELLKRPVAYQPILGKAFGSVNLAILWCQLFYHFNNTADIEDGWTKKGWTEMYYETGLSRQEQTTAKALGKKLGVIETSVRGFPRETYYRISQERAIELVETFLQKNPEQQGRIGIKIETTLFGKKVSVERGPVITLPPWLNKEIWEEWETYRREIKKALKDSTRKQQISFLEEHKADHVEIITTSIRNGWTGLFPLKKAGAGSGRKASNVITPKEGKYAGYGK